MKILWFSEGFWSLPTISEGSRKRAEDVSIVYHLYLRVQGPESRVQSPVQLLDYASAALTRPKVICFYMLLFFTLRKVCHCYKLAILIGELLQMYVNTET